MKKYVIITLTLVVLGVFGFSVWGATGKNKGEDEIQVLSRMDTSAFDHVKRPPVMFDHDEHNDTAEIDDCAICHHVWENGTLVADESSEDSPCSQCHQLKSGPENKMALANAFHTQCRTCHIDGGKGPLLCGQCHRIIQGGE